MKKGFTMVELIFVIVILGILAAIAIPRLNATRVDAEITKALANISTIKNDLSTYYTSQARLEDKLSDMTDVPLIDDPSASDPQAATIAIAGEKCIRVTFRKNDQTTGAPAAFLVHPYPFSSTTTPQTASETCKQLTNTKEFKEIQNHDFTFNNTATNARESFQAYMLRTSGANHAKGKIGYYPIGGISVKR